MASLIIRTKDFDPEERVGILIDENCIFNLPVLQTLLGGIKRDSAKKWAVSRGLGARFGKEWLFSGKMLRDVLEKEFAGPEDHV